MKKHDLIILVLCGLISAYSGEFFIGEYILNYHKELLE